MVLMSLALANKEDNVKDININYIEGDYNSFLEDKKANSYHTFKSYRGDLKQFFDIMYDKEPKFVTLEDLEKTTGNDITSFRLKLRSKYPINKTVNRKVNAVKSFFKYMETDNENVRSAIFNKTKKLKETNSSQWGILTYEEVLEMIDISKGFEHGDQLTLLIELGFKTCIRLDALLTMTWGNIHKRHQHGKDIWTIEVIDKGEEHVKAIADNVKERLDSLRWSSSNEEKVFKNWHEHKVGDAIRKMCKEMNIDPRRKIRFHSLKKAGINFVFDSTGDIMMAQKQGNHKSAKTTIDSYMKHKEDLTSMPSYTMGEEINLSSLTEMNKEDLLELIQKSSATTKLELIRLSGNL
jgi:integrase